MLISMEFQITSKNKWRIFYRGLCFSIILWSIAMFIMIFYFPDWWWESILYILACAFLIDIGPGIYLFKEQLKFNHGCLLSIQNNHLSFTDSSGCDISVEFNEIKDIIVYIPPNNYRNTITMIAMEDFSYARFELKNGREFYVTSLMVPKLRKFVNEYLPGVMVKYHRWWIFPSIRLCNYFRRKKGLLPEHLEEKP
mgnify:CR=1 FL=1